MTKIKRLPDLIAHLDPISTQGIRDQKIHGIESDSRKIAAGYCFVAIRGFKQDGLDYLDDALSRGACCVVTTADAGGTYRDKIDRGELAWIKVANDRLAMSRLAAAFYDNPTRHTYNIGITGTNGKTTVMSLTAAVLGQREKTATVGTLGMSCGKAARKTGLTTPEITDIFKFLAEECAPGCRNLVMEASSVALKLYRVEDIEFSQAIFTNFSGDHLDFHGTMEEYFQAKMRLFDKLSPRGTAVINLDDPRGPQIISRLKNPCLTYGFTDSAQVSPTTYRLDLDGIRAKIKTPAGPLEITSPLIGKINLLNILAVVAASVVKGVPFEHIRTAVKEFQPVRGRLDFAYKGAFSVLVDYAHTDDALESLLKSLRPLTDKRIVAVFGAGGARDRSKRPRMGQAVSQNADITVVTSDNPRSEDPLAIIEDITGGFAPGFKDFVVEVDREKAIKKAIDLAGKGDLVVIAGKGHEDYQIFKDKTIHFDDYEVVRRVLNIRAEGKQKNG